VDPNPQSSPAVTAAGQVVASLEVGSDGMVIALQQSDGTLAWSYSGSSDFSSPVSDTDGNIYIQTVSAVDALSPQGSLLWTTPVNAGFGLTPPSPAMDNSGTLYINGGGDQTLIAYESTGQQPR
jgi:outer membrane protein assembly factor BamB